MSSVESERLPERRTEALHKGRVSLAGARYFVTCSAKRPEVRLIDSPVADELQAIFVRMEADGDWRILCSTIMPDHVHFVVRLTGRLVVGRAVSKFKSLPRKLLDARGIRWQRDFFEHRLRPEEDVTGFARYVFMNPYRAGLVSFRQEWSWWRRGNEECVDLEQQLVDRSLPPEEWRSTSLEQFKIRPEVVGE